MAGKISAYSTDWEGVSLPLSGSSAWAISYDYENGGTELKVVGHSRDEVMQSLQELLLHLSEILYEEGMRELGKED